MRRLFIGALWLISAGAAAQEPSATEPPSDGPEEGAAAGEEATPIVTPEEEVSENGDASQEPDPASPGVDDGNGEVGTPVDAESEPSGGGEDPGVGDVPGLVEGDAKDPAPVAPAPVDLTEYLPKSGTFKPHVQVGAFADFGLYAEDNFESSRLRVGQLVFHSTAMMTQHFSAFTELSLDSDPAPAARVHRLLFRWEMSDALMLSAGRYHVPVTWWNSTVHHGLWLQTTAGRPRFLDFSSSLIPAHSEGVFATGVMPFLSGLGIRYNLAVSGGDADHSHHAAAEPEQADDQNSEHTDHTDHMDMMMDAVDAGSGTPSVPVTTSLVLAIEPRAIPHLRIGVSGLYGPIKTSDLAGVTTVGGAHIAYTSERPEFLVEVVTTSNVVAGSERYASIAGYAQLGFRLPVLGQRLKPYARYEQLFLDEDDPFNTDLQDYTAVISGLRIDMIRTMAVKIEAEYDKTASMDGTWGGAVQVCATW